MAESKGDRRGSPRRPLTVSVSLHTSEETFSYELRDVSEGGVYLRGTSHLPTCVPCEIDLHTDEGPPVSGVVVRQEDLGASFGLAVRFDSPVDRERIHRWSGGAGETER